MTSTWSSSRYPRPPQDGFRAQRHQAREHLDRWEQLRVPEVSIVLSPQIGPVTSSWQISVTLLVCPPPVPSIRCSKMFRTFSTTSKLCYHLLLFQYQLLLSLQVMPVGTPDYIAPEVLQCLQSGERSAYAPASFVLLLLPFSTTFNFSPQPRSRMWLLVPGYLGFRDVPRSLAFHWSGGAAPPAPSLHLNLSPRHSCPRAR